jgi:peptidoglycan/xylan/chitin deacetylase (PgdA/CDA1 family)
VEGITLNQEPTVHRKRRRRKKNPKLFWWSILFFIAVLGVIYTIQHIPTVSSDVSAISDEVREFLDSRPTEMPSFVDRALSGYVWNSPKFVPPRDDGVFELVSTQHPYGKELTLPILMYHSISSPARVLCVTPSGFKSQMESLYDNGYVGITLETALLYARGLPVRMPSKPVVLTFDDGYKDFIEEAVPILEQFGFRATVFIIADFVGRQGYMTWDDVRKAAAMGHEIGCHSMTHPDLRDLRDASLEYQIVSARDFIESNGHVRPRTFCYPSGKYNDTVRSVVEEAGYLGAVTTQVGTASTLDDHYTLSRIRIDGSASLTAFRKQIGLQ